MAVSFRFEPEGDTVLAEKGAFIGNTVLRENRDFQRIEHSVPSPAFQSC
jgi:hypothetical protein